METRIRLVAITDLPAIREIYNFYVLRSTCTYQLEIETEAERLAWFHERSERHPGVVAERCGELVGWAALSQWKSRAGYANTAEISVYVRHDSHRQGIGLALISNLIERGRAAGLHVIIGGASAEQTASLALLKSLGFEQVAHFRQTGRKFGQWLDVIYTQLSFGNNEV